MPYPYERSHYRIQYPSVEGPRLVVGTRICRVVDCSERGLRFRLAGEPTPEVGTSLRARLRFPRGVDLRVEGVVVRVQGSDVALRLAGSGIPFRVILKEQLYLRRAQME